MICPSGKRRSVDAQRRTDIVKDDLPLDIADAEGVVVKIGDFALRHSGGDGKDRLAAIQNESEDSVGALHGGLPVSRRQPAGRAKPCLFG